MPVSSASVLQRTSLLLSAAVVALLAIVAVSLWLAARIDSHSDEVVRERSFRTGISNVLSLLQDAETGQRGFLLTGDRRYLEPYDAARSRLDEEIARLRAFAANEPGTSIAVSRVQELTNTKLAELSETIALATAGRTEAALDVVRSDRGKTIMDDIRTLLASMIDDAETRVSDRLDAMRRSSQALIWTTIVGAVLIVLFAGGAGWTVARHTREVVAARREVEALNVGLEQRVAERTADLSRANEEIQRFAYIVSHDLRSPLVNIMGFTSELETGMSTLQRFAAVATAEADQALTDNARTAANEDLPEAVRFIRASTSKMDRLINAILRLSREGRRDLNPERIELSALLTHAAASVQHQLDEAGARVDIAPRSPSVVSDRLALEQVFGNLVDNAVKYLSSDRPGVITISAARRGSRVEISVADNGRGIAPQDGERIFELFRRSGVQDRPGEGIGLAHVRALVRRLGGDIQVESELGRGTTFRVDLPLTLQRQTVSSTAS
jgi:signal transduction histidine kinase